MKGKFPRCYDGGRWRAADGMMEAGFACRFQLEMRDCRDRTRLVVVSFWTQQFLRCILPFFSFFLLWSFMCWFCYCFLKKIIIIQDILINFTTCFWWKGCWCDVAVEERVSSEFASFTVILDGDFASAMRDILLLSNSPLPSWL